METHFKKIIAFSEKFNLACTGNNAGVNALLSQEPKSLEKAGMSAHVALPMWIFSSQDVLF